MKSVNQHLVQTDGMFFLYGRKATDIMEMWMPYAEKLGKEFFDLDDMIIAKAGKSKRTNRSILLQNY
jgi:hypothetical protein